MLLLVLVYQGFRNKIPQIGWLKQQIYFLTVLEARSPRSSYQRVSSEASLIGLQMATSLCPHMVVHLCCLCLIFLGHQSYWIGAHPKDPILTQLPL